MPADDEDGAACVLPVVRGAGQEQAHRAPGAVGFGTGEHGTLHTRGAGSAVAVPECTHGTPGPARGLSHSGAHPGTGGPGAAYLAHQVLSDRPVPVHGGGDGPLQQRDTGHQGDADAGADLGAGAWRVGGDRGAPAQADEAMGQQRERGHRHVHHCGQCELGELSGLHPVHHPGG